MGNFLIDLCCEIINHLVDYGGFSEADQVELIAVMKMLSDKKED